MMTMQQDQTTSTPDQTVTLAYVEDSHNLGCLVRYSGEFNQRRAHFSQAIQEHGVVIRSGNLVVVDEARDPVQVIWRAGSLATVQALSQGQLTVNLGYRTLTLPLRDERPEAERMQPVAVGNRVLLRGSPIEQAAVTDVVVDGELAHLERLRAALARALSQWSCHVGTQP
jgi:hypothetical protein